MLNIKLEKEGSELRVALDGRLNSVSSKELTQELDDALDGALRVVFDFTNLEYISSAGLRVLLAVEQRMEQVGGESVCVRNANETVRDTLEMTGFRGVINVE